MKAVVGVDRDGLYRNALDLLGHVRFERMEAELIHVEEPLLLYGAGMYPLAVEAIGEVEEGRCLAAETLLRESLSEACALDIKARSTYTVGGTTQVLMKHANQIHADLLVVGSHRKSKYGRFFLGSVGKGLALNAHQSLLISKKPIGRDGRITAVVATDYSEYSERCIRLLLRMNPKGFEKVYILTATDKVKDPLSTKSRDCRREIETRAHRMVAHFEEAGISAQSMIVEGDVHHVIDETVESTQADLLILGAHGHGFFDRVFVGSVSLQEAIAGPSNVLLLRSS